MKSSKVYAGLDEKDVVMEFFNVMPDLIYKFHEPELGVQNKK
jgi:hypothetical protein